MIRHLSRAGVLLGALLLTITPGMAAIQVELNGRPLQFDVPPTLVSGRTMVPLRGIFESMGAQVNWDANTRTIAATKGATDVQLSIGDPRATVNGRTVLLDAPAMILNGSTMVPLRFVSEALGADVKWFEATQMVSITTGVAVPPEDATKPATQGQTMVIPQGTVIPVRLDKALSSATARQEDLVTVTVRSAYDGDAEFPRGTKIRGVVSAVQRAGDGQPGMLDLSFREVLLPNGQRVSAEGSLISLDEKMVMQTSDGRLVVRDSNSNDRLKFIGIGAGVGLILGKWQEHTLEGTLLGAAAGYLYSEYDRRKAQPTDVTVAEGTEFGVRLDRQLTYRPSPAFAVARANYLQAPLAPVSPPSGDIGVTIAGRAISFEGAQPFQEDGIVLVPLAPVMGEARVGYNYDERLQTLRVDTTEGELKLRIGDRYALLNGEREDLEAPAQVRDGVIFVPLHFLALATGTRVVWVADTRTVTMHVPS
ncbi:MAG TPA: copper amine oxidase N-terminal domain-containing protein [Anaerolineae bacterium]|nr:copper amine oxidase N-terminal domain-containing protein [Anaerolineae bacterium]